MSKQLLLVTLFLYAITISAQTEISFVISPLEYDIEINSNTASAPEFVPFELVGGLVFVDGIMEGKESKFILDTGSPGLILNKKPKRNSDQFIASGLTGNTSIGETTVREFKILDLVISNFTAYQMDLGHIENEILHKFDGLVGGDVFAESILILDYVNQKWAQSSTISKEDEVLEISFETIEHFLVLEFEIDGKTRRFVMDTGAEINLIDEKVYRTLDKNLITSSSELAIQGAGVENIGSHCAVIDEISLANNRYRNQTFSIIDFSFINEGIEEPFDGLIGFPFFKDKKIAFDFKKELIYLWK